jgi:hypothetical protein
VLGVVGVERVNSDLRRLGFSRTELRGGVDLVAIQADINGFGVSTPGELVDLAVRLSRGEIFNQRVSYAVLSLMAQQQRLDQIPRYLPYNPYSRDMGIEPTVKIASKAGSFAGVRADMAVVETPAVHYALAVMTSDSEDRSFGVDSEGTLAVASISRAVYEELHLAAQGS